MPEKNTPPASTTSDALPQDPLVADVVKDPTQPANALLLQGFLGNAAEPGHTRLYLDPELSTFVDIPTDAILRTQPLPPEQSALGGTAVWIKKDAVLIHSATPTTPTKSTFLEGPIFQDFLSRAQTSAGSGATPQAITQFCPGHSLPALCPPQTILPAACPPQTVHSVCVICVQPTQLVACQPTHVACPPTHVACPPPTQHSVCVICVQPTHAVSACVVCPPPPTHAASACVVCPPVTQHSVCVVCVQPTHVASACLVCPPPPTHAASACVICPSVACPSIEVCPVTHVNCPQVTIAGCPSLGVCPSIACGPNQGGEQQF